MTSLQTFSFERRRDDTVRTSVTGQLRQPMLLTDGQGVISQAPAEGVLHPRNVLDTLGADSPEKLCPNAR